MYNYIIKPLQYNYLI